MVTQLTQLGIRSPEGITAIVAAIVAAMVQPAEFTAASYRCDLVQLFEAIILDLN
jgi:hypothetical protein